MDVKLIKGWKFRELEKVQPSVAHCMDFEVHYIPLYGFVFSEEKLIVSY